MPKPNILLQKERKKRGWTQDQLAEMVGADPDSIGNWESGRRGTSRYYQTRLVSVFGLPPEQLGFPAGSAERTALPDEVVPNTSIPGGSVLSPSQEENPGQIEHFLLNQENDENRQSILRRIRSTWIEGVLKHFLDPGPGTSITPNLIELPEALENPWHLLVRETNSAARELPEGTSIVQMYDIANEELLILGEPGAGKTTLLLELTRELLIRAEQNAKYPIPVIFNLTSWTKKQSSLTEWMIEEMQIKYHIPAEAAHTWIVNDQIIILLDGLDEVATEALSSCFKAIREYQDSRSRSLLVICCRRREYFAQDVRLSLQKAVLIQPLTREQIDQYLTTTDGRLEAVRQALQDDPELAEMCTTPLLLNIAARAYQVKATAILTSGGSLETRRQQIFSAYVERMLSRRGMDTRYNQRQTIHWLTWLAGQMQKRSQTEFYLEKLQPTWLPGERVRHRFRHAVIRMVYGIESLLLAGLFALLPGDAFRNVIIGYFGQSASNPDGKMFGWIAPGLGESSVSQGIILALVAILVSFMINFQASKFSLPSVWRSLVQAMRSGIFVGSIIGIFAVFVFISQIGIGNGFIRGADIGLIGGLLIAFQSGLIAGLSGKNISQSHLEQYPQQSLFTSLWSGRLFDRLFDFVTFGCFAGVGYGSISALLTKGTIQDVVSYGAIIALFFGLLFGGNATERFQDIGESIHLTGTVAWSWTAARHKLNTTLKRGSIMGIVVTVCIMVVLGTAGSLFYGLNYGIRFGFVCGPSIGLTGAIAGILTGILNSGWQTATLSDHQIIQPNEGTRRSLKNAIFAACLFGPIGGVASGFVSGLAFGYIEGLPEWAILAMIFVLIFSVIFAFQFALAYGGIAWLQHYLLRWYLWRSGNFPVNCERFLDYASERIFMIKVEGGYMFAHKLLLDYFASLSLHAVEPNQEEEKELSHVNRTTPPQNTS